MGALYDYSIVTLAVLYCILFVYSNLKLLLSWCIVGLQKGLVSILAVSYMFLLLFDLLMIIMITSYDNDVDQQQYVDHSKLPLIVRIIGQYVILYLNFIINGIILLCFLLFFSGLFGVKLNKKHIYCIVIIDIIYFLIILISSMLIEFTDINIINIPILSYIYIITMLINTIWSIFCLYKLPIALPIDLSIGLYQKNTICSCYTTVTRYIWYIAVIIIPQIIFICLNILEINIWDFHIQTNDKFMNILSIKHARILFFISQFLMLICIWNVLRISIQQNVELNIVLNVIKELHKQEEENDKKIHLLSISDEIAIKNEDISAEKNINTMTLSIPQEQNTINMKKGILVNQDSEYSERELQTDQEDETNHIVFNDNESPQHEPIQVENNNNGTQSLEMINININNGANDKDIHSFQVIVDGIMLYKEQELLNEIFDMQIKNGEIIKGFYINDTCKVIYLIEYKVYISAIEVNELPNTTDNNVMNDMPQMNNLITSNSISEMDNTMEPEIEKDIIKFKVVVDGVGLYSDKLLKEEIFSVQIHDNEIVDGYYIDNEYKIVYLIEFKLYISSMDVREIGNETEMEMDENKAEEKQHKIEPAADINIETNSNWSSPITLKYDQQSNYSELISPIKYDQQSNYSEATTQITNTDNVYRDNFRDKDQSVMAESESLDIHNYSMTTKININATNLPFVPDVDDINEESNENGSDNDLLELDEVSQITPVINTQITPVINTQITPVINTQITPTIIMNNNMDTPVIDIVNENDNIDVNNMDNKEEENQLEIEQNNNGNMNLENENENVHIENGHEQSMSSSSFVPNINNENNEEEDEEEESTVNTEINYSYSSTEATATQTETAPNIIMNFD